ncbi:MAG: hypothetical protein AAF745_13310 [Planctomycetota bacterium]
MKRIVTHLAFAATTAMLASGCVPVRHNLPPEQRLMQPGPGVGGPGPGVLGQPAFGGGPASMGMMASTDAPDPSSTTDTMVAKSHPKTPTNPITPAGSTAPIAADPVEFGLAGLSPSNQPEIQQVGFRHRIAGGCQSCGDDCNSGPGGCLSGPSSNIPPGGGVMMGMPMMPPMTTAQVTFGSPDGMQVRYDISGNGMFDSEPLVVPARQNFPQGGLYRLKLTNIPTRPGVELYPTVELAYANPRTGAYLAHNSVPIQFDEEDFDQVLTGNFVTKVIYLPDPDFQGPALAGIDTLVSTRLDPGIDPIVEADRRGSILAIIRLGDKDIEMAGGGVVGGMMGPPIAGLPAPFAPAMTEGCGGPDGCGSSMGGGVPASLPGAISGVNVPQYGMPYSGTPIGLPGPPHIPLGAPAGLKKHTIRNHTHMHIPRPVEHMQIDVRQQPGMSYPNPVSRVRITEQNIHPGVPNARPQHYQSSQRVY